MALDYSEIADSTRFEQLVARYFERISEKKDVFPQISTITVTPSGMGTDEGCDILVTFDVNDFITTYSKRWIIQCKFYTRPVGPSDINQIDIPTLIHSYGADGYLLVCSSYPTSGITKLFDRLRKKCKFNYKYECWDGAKLEEKILTDQQILQQFFPNYFNQLPR